MISEGKLVQITHWWDDFRGQTGTHNLADWMISGELVNTHDLPGLVIPGNLVNTHYLVG